MKFAPLTPIPSPTLPLKGRETTGAPCSSPFKGRETTGAPCSSPFKGRETNSLPFKGRVGEGMGKVFHVNNP
ncbi:MAG: hypothetical protein Q8O31_00715 [Rhodocyclaceae bacterium]|nr:hypothetical protein [Rhodocyclaceae bacterium]